MSSKKSAHKRVGWDEYFMNIAQLVATRATCDRGSDLKYIPGRKGVGAVIVKDRVIMSTGYNGSPRGLDHCDEAGHEMVEGHCVRTVHAEANALAQAARNGVAINGGEIYTTASPCYDCFKLLVNAGIKRIVCGSFYGSRYGASEKVLTLAAQAGVKLEFIREESETVNEEGSSKLKVKVLDSAAKVPDYAYDGDAGLDLYSVEEIELPSGSRAKIPTGIALEIPEGHVGLIWDRSGVPLKKGLKVVGGVVDAGYRGEVFVGIANISKEPVIISEGEKIAQMLIQSVDRPQVEIVDELEESQRGTNTLGSSDESDYGYEDSETDIEEDVEEEVDELMEEIDYLPEDDNEEYNEEGGDYEDTKSRW